MRSEIDKLNSKKPTISKWLEQLQQNSWELELIISGLAIFGLIQFSEYINSAGRYHTANISDDVVSDIKVILLVLGDIGTSIFIFNLIIHLFVRGLWIGAVGLRYVSGDFDFDQLNFSDQITSFYKRSIVSFDHYIQKLENLASVIFSFTFLLVFVLISSMILVLIVFLSDLIFNDLLRTSLGNRIDLFLKPLSITLSLATIVVFIDFISLGVFKRIKQRHLSSIYYCLYRFIGVVTLSFSWRPLLINFLDNTYTRKLLWFIVPYFTIGILSISDLSSSPYVFYPLQKMKEARSGESHYVQEVSKHSIHPFYYDRVRKENELYDRFIIEALSLKDYRIDDDFLEVFIKYDDDFDSTLMNREIDLLANRASIFNRLYMNRSKRASVFNFSQTLAPKNLEKAVGKNIEDVLSACKNSILFKIDELQVFQDSYHCEFYQHANAGELGLLCFLPLDSIYKGRHLLEYNRISEKLQSVDTLKYYIPFYKSQ